ncbi:MAG: TIGR02281 family clan AA aspartic protease [Ancalomicrobiaceae bacterium]|nr:TIGR02281 family clan AA aspartic protease [Ancalomicrobiaceae bacterium]
MLKNALRLLFVICFVVFWSPVWLPKLVGFTAWVVDRPDIPPEKVAGYRTWEANAATTRGRNAELKADSRGHFEVQALVNGRSIDVMVDTGATSVALRYEDALRLGLRPDPDEFSIPISTANGTTKAARATLNEVRIGDVRVKNVEALVVPAKALATNLLGMSFMRRLSKVEMAGGKLLLEE